MVSVEHYIIHDDDLFQIKLLNDERESEWLRNGRGGSGGEIKYGTEINFLRLDLFLALKMIEIISANAEDGLSEKNEIFHPIILWWVKKYGCRLLQYAHE